MKGRLGVVVAALLLGLSGAACQGRPSIVIPTVAQLPTLTPTPSPRPTLPPTWTPTFTWTPSLTPTLTPTPTTTPTYTDTPTDTPTPTATETPTPTSTATFTVSPIPAVRPNPGPANPAAPPAAPAASLDYFNAAPPPGVSGAEARLWSVPVIPVLSARLRQIFASGQQNGMRANVFSKVGDCHTTSDAFLLPLGVGEYDLGPYGYLQNAINFFSASPRDGVANSFVNESMAASSAFNAGAVLDPVWANPMHCQQGEAPLLCEYRLVRPAVAVILLGAVDMQVYDVGAFRSYLQQVVQATVERGIIPVLTTYPSAPEFMWPESLEFNAVILDVAAQQQLPVINFWRASRVLPSYGLEGDFFHLSHPESRWISFNGDERRWGMTLRNLLTLYTLDLLRRQVLAS